MPETTVADRKRVLLKLVHHRLDDAGAGQDDVRPFRLKAHNRTAVVQQLRAVHLDLALHLGPFDDGTLNDGGIVFCQAMFDRGHIGDGAAHAYESIGDRPIVEPGKIGGNRILGGLQLLRRYDVGETELLGVANGTDVDAEALLDVRPVAEGKLRAPTAGIEDGQRALRQS